MLVKPLPEEYNPAVSHYIELIGERQIVLDLESSLQELMTCIAPLTEEQASFRYQADKWSIKQLLGHLADTERIMCYRILRIARGDHTPLFPFDDQLFVANAPFDTQSLEIRREELNIVRQATLILFQSISAEAWLRQHLYNQHMTSARAFAYVLAGHFRHHLQVLQDRYLIQIS
jgi:hypothetical protein